MTLFVFIQIAFASMVPVTELQGAIPLFLTLNPGLNATLVAIAAVLGAMVPPLILLKLLPFLTDWLHRHLEIRAHSKLRFIKDFLDWFYRKAHQKHSATVEKWGSAALLIITAIPFAVPGSGVWTGTALGFLFHLPYWRSLLYILIGCTISATIVTLVSTGILSGFGVM